MHGERAAQSRAKATNRPLIREFFDEMQAQDEDAHADACEAELNAEYGDESELDWQEYKESRREKA